MTNTPNTNKKLSEYSLDDLKAFFIDLTRKISSKVILLEIGNNFFNIALAKSQNNKLQIKKIFRQDLPTEAIAKSIPADVEAFSNILQVIIKEQKLFTQRVAISLSSDACYTRLIEIPSHVKEEEVRDLLGNSNSGIQIPISLNNSDFEITKTTLPSILRNENSYDRYFLTSIPKKNINLILEIIKKINLELCSIQMSHMCVGNLFKSEIEKLNSNELIISIDLLDEFTQLIIFDKNGPIFIKRLGAIRKYPTIEEMKLINNKSKKESSNNSDYYPLSKLDIKVLTREIKDSYAKFCDVNNFNKKAKIFLTGRNSQHKDLVSLLGSSLNMDVSLISPLGNHNLLDFSYDPDLINQFSLSRIIGLGLSLMDEKYENMEYQNSNEFLIERFKSEKKNNIATNNSEIKISKKSKTIEKNKLFKKEEPKAKKELANKNEVLPPLPDLGIKGKKEEPKAKKELANKNEVLPPLPELGIKGKKEEPKAKKEATNEKEEENDSINQEDQEFKMDTSFLDID